MKKIRTSSGGMLFLDEDDYMPRLLVYLRETAGEDAANLVEAWAAEERERYLGVMANAEARVESTARELREERADHLVEIEELEAELTNLAELKDLLMESNYVMTDLIRNPEKMFPAIGTEVYRDTKEGGHDEGRIDSYKMRLHNGAPEFFTRVVWRVKMGGGFVARPVWLRFKNLGKTFHILPAEEGAE